MIKKNTITRINRIITVTVLSSIAITIITNIVFISCKSKDNKNYNYKIQTDYMPQYTDTFYVVGRFVKFTNQDEETKMIPIESIDYIKNITK